MTFATTEELPVPERLIDQVIGQDEAVEVARKAAAQKRNLLLIGEPGTGKSMIAKAMAEMLPARQLSDVVVHHNREHPNTPRITRVEAGMGARIIAKYDRRAQQRVRLWTFMEYGLALGTVAFGLALWLLAGESILALFFSVLIAVLFLHFIGQSRPRRAFLVPKVLVGHRSDAATAPYVDATGAHAGALLGDVRHDPFQSGGLETPPHLRVEAGAIHRAHGGLLFIDEINVLRLPSQQALLTAMQERTYPIMGQSQNSSGAMIRTEEVPCDFILVAAGNLDAVRTAEVGVDGGMHPALRSRIRGYGYEVFVHDSMEDSHANRSKLAQFVAQEVRRDGRIPHFDREAVAEVIREAQRRCGTFGRLTLRLRELGGLVRTAGDVARSEGSDRVTRDHVVRAKVASRSLEQQILEAEVRFSTGDRGVGQAPKRRIGCARAVVALGTGEVGEPAGMVVDVEAASVPVVGKGGAVLPGPGLRVPGARVENIAPVVRSLLGSSSEGRDLHVDAVLGHPAADATGVGLAAFVAAASSLLGAPVRGDDVFIADIGLGGGLVPVAATLQRIEAAASHGPARVFVPSSFRGSLLLDPPLGDAVEVRYCASVTEVMAHVMPERQNVQRRGGPRAAKTPRTASSVALER